FIATNEPLTAEDIEEEIGQITNEVNGNAETNGEARGLPQGTKLYKIKGREILSDDSSGYIAYETDGQLLIASKWNEPQ
ncbi:hypothetical protein, partial [Alkalibacillus haloalkaliphilus]